MMRTDVLFAGFGGHGMLLAGKLVAIAAMKKGKQVSWLPAYGAEMRGGTANTTVCISNDTVSSPYIERPQSLVVMNTPSLEKFGPRVKPGGHIVINTTLSREPFERKDCTVMAFPAGDIATDLGSIKSTNLVLLGAYVGLTGVVDNKAVIAAIEDQFAMKPAIMNNNVKAFNAGFKQGVAFAGGKGAATATERESSYAHSDDRPAG